MAGRGIKGTDDGSGYAEQGENAELRRELENLKEFVGKLAQACSLEQIFTKGFDDIRDQLEEKLAPLRALAPVRAALPEKAAASLRDIRLSLNRPNFNLDETKSIASNDQSAKEQAS